MVKIGSLVKKADDIEYWKKRGIRSFIVDASNRLGIVIKVSPWGCTVQWNDGETLVYKPEQLEVVS